MQKNTSRTPRFFVTETLAENQPTALRPDHAHYLGQVMRLSIGDMVRVFNGEDAEWLAEIEQISKRGCIICNKEKLRGPQKLMRLLDGWSGAGTQTLN